MIEVNENGGKQSYIGARFDLIPPTSLYAAAVVLAQGAKKYGSSNWKRITTNEHLNHALNHVNLHLLGDESEDHLSHAMVRLMMAFHVEYNGVVTNEHRSEVENHTDFVELYKQLYTEG